MDDSCRDSNRNKRIKLSTSEEQVSNLLDSDPTDSSQNFNNSNLSSIEINCNKHIASTETKNESFLKFVAKLLNYSSIPRNKAIEIINDSSKLLLDISKNLETQVMVIVNKLTQNKEIEDQIHEIFDGINFHDELESFTEWKLLRLFETMGTYIPPKPYVVGEIQEFIKSKKTKKLQMKEISAQYVPMRTVLKKYFEIPGIYIDTIEYMKLLENKKIISNVVQSDLWAYLSADFTDKVILPVNLYFDDYETNNPIGSHKGVSKCGAIYLSLPCLPPRLTSKLENIFLFAIFNSLDRKTFGNSVLFSTVIDELIFLENYGIKININNSQKHIYFRLALFLGDNLGLHEVYGLTSSFNATYCCRFCKIKLEDIQNAFIEDKTLMRNEENYLFDLNKKDTASTGVSEPCILHKLPKFHLTRNLSVDILHDIYEGICLYDIGLICHHFIKIKKYFDLITLNHSIRCFNYGPATNVPPEILPAHIDKKHLSMTGAEISCLIRHLLLIIDDLVPHDIDAWDLIILLQKIVGMVTEKHLSPKSDLVFRQLVEDYLRLLTQMFPGCLKPKHHFLTHYPTVFRTSGPWAHMSSVRFESKHREAKMTSKSSLNRTNVCLTIAIKHQLRFNYRLISNKDAVYHIYDHTLCQIVKRIDLEEANRFIPYLPTPLNNSTEFSTVPFFYYDGNMFTVDDLTMIPTENGESFHKIHCIILNNEEVIIITKRKNDVFYDCDLNAFEVMSECFKWEILEIDDFGSSVKTHQVMISENRSYIVKSWF